MPLPRVPWLWEPCRHCWDGWVQAGACLLWASWALPYLSLLPWWSFSSRYCWPEYQWVKTRHCQHLGGERWGQLTALLSPSPSLSVSLYHTSSGLFLCITRFKAQTVPCGKCLTADSFLSALLFRLHNPNPEMLLCLSWSNPCLWAKLSPLPCPSCDVLTVHSDPDLLDVCWGNFVGSLALILARLLSCDPQDLQVLLLTFKLSA